MHIKKGNKDLSKHLFVWSILFYPAVLFLVLYVAVNIGSVVLAFQDIGLNGARTFVGLKNFKDFISSITVDPLVKTSIINSLKMFFINFVISMPLYIIFSFYFYKSFAGSKYFRLIVMIPAIVSSFIMCMIFAKFVEGPLPALLSKLSGERAISFLKDPDYAFGTTLFYMIWISFSTSLVVFPNAMNAIPDEVVESSEIDGANMFHELWYITLPLIYPTLCTFIVVGVAAIFTNTGPLVAFYIYHAPHYVQNVGYYMLAEVMRDEANAIFRYPFLAAGGIAITLVSAPVTYLVKYLLEKYGPSAEF